MRETPISNNERAFITKGVKENLRLDGRKNDEFRKVNINFGADWGSVLVCLGETKVLAQVSCELGVPNLTRPNEGHLFLNVEMGPMAASHFEPGRFTDLHVQVTRTLERTFKDSRCLDLESLCITAEERVWILRCDLNVLNHAGNLIDCCSIAALCALAHFKRPEVSIVEDEVRIHTAAEKEPIAMVMHHYPLCVSHCTFNEGKIAVADPTALEERSAESSMIFGLNSFRELCCLNLGGSSLTSTTLLLKCAHRAAERVKKLVEDIKLLLEADKEQRAAGKKVSFAECLRENQITADDDDRLALRLRNFSFHDLTKLPNADEKAQLKEELQSDNTDDEMADDLCQMLDATENKPVQNMWLPDMNDDDDEHTADDKNERNSDGELIS